MKRLLQLFLNVLLRSVNKVSYVTVLGFYGVPLALPPITVLFGDNDDDDGDDDGGCDSGVSVF